MKTQIKKAKIRLKINDATLYHFTGSKRDLTDEKGTVFHCLEDNQGGYLGFNDGGDKWMYSLPHRRTFFREYRGEQIYQGYMYPPVIYVQGKRKSDSGMAEVVNFIKSAFVQYTDIENKTTPKIDLAAFVYLYTYGESNALKYSHITGAIPEPLMIVSREPFDKSTLLKPENLILIKNKNQSTEYLSEITPKLKPIEPTYFYVVRAGFYLVSQKDNLFEDRENYVQEPRRKNDFISIKIEGNPNYLSPEDLTREIMPFKKQIWDALDDIGAISDDARYSPKYELGYWLIEYTAEGYDVFEGSKIDDKTRHKYNGIIDFFKRAYYKTSNIELDPISVTVVNETSKDKASKSEEGSNDVMILKKLTARRNKLMSDVDKDPTNRQKIYELLKFINQNRAYHELSKGIDLNKYRELLDEASSEVGNEVILNAITKAQDKPSLDNYKSLIKVIKKYPKASPEGVDLNETLKNAYASVKNIESKDIKEVFEGLLQELAEAQVIENASKKAKEIKNLVEELEDYQSKFPEVAKDYEEQIAKYISLETTAKEGSDTHE